MGKKKKDYVDKYRVSKCPLQQILLEDTDFSPVASAIDRTNEIVTFSYMFLRLYILHLIEHNKNIPIITRTFIKMAFKVISKKSNGPKPKGDNLDIYNKFQVFYDSKFSKIVKNTLLDSSNLSSILDYSAIEMLTNIENNIWMHFTSRVKLFVNQMFKQYIKTTLDKYTGKENKAKSHELNSEIKKVKKALLENTYNCDKKYHKWLNKYSSKILPQTFNKSYAYDVKCNPQKYLPYMIRMSSILEEKGLKQFQFFPLRTEITSKNITLDTKAIVELLVSSNKTEYLFNISKYHNKLWSDYFNTSDKIFKQNSYSFDHKIKTDGYSVSVQLINNKCIEEEIQKRKQMVAASNKAKAEYKGKSKEDIQKIKDNKEKNQKKKATKARILAKKVNQETQLKEKEAFGKLSKEEQDKIIQEKLRDNYEEFPYIDELVKDDKLDLKQKKKVYIDPGKRNLYCMIDDQGTILKYTNGTRIRNTKRLKYMKLRENHKKKLKILEIESELSNYNSKSCSYNVFKKYIIKKFEVNNKLTSIYSVDDYYKKLKWFSYLNTKRSEVKLIRLIKRTYGSDIIIIMGDWSQGKQMRHFMSTPNLSLKRLLAQEFTVYNVDEFRTSCLHYKTEKRCENLYLPDKKNKIRKIHSILTYKMENRRQGCIDRDKNGVKNIRKMVHNYLETDERPKRYCRGVILEEETQSNIKVNKRPRTFKKSNLKNVKSGQCSYRHASPKPT